MAYVDKQYPDQITIDLWENGLEKEVVSFIQDFENKYPFKPGETNNTSYVSFLLDSVYKEFFKPANYKHGKPRTLLDLSDTDLIESVWDIFRGICIKYGSACTVQRFGVFSGIGYMAITGWQDGTYRTAKHAETAKKFHEQSESDLLNRAIDSNSIGAIFALKAGFGYSDAPPQQLTIRRDDTPMISQEEINKRLELLEDNED